VEVKIGVQNVARELSIETDQSAEAVAAAVRSALSEDAGVLALTDSRGREVLVPTAALAYVQVGDSEKGRVGFGTVPVPATAAATPSR
jgi:hypothetical protein